MAETYAYQVRDGAGKTVSGTIVADSQQLVLERLREMGYVPLKVAVKKTGMKREFSFRKTVKLKDLAVFSRQFATMVSSGLPMLKSLNTLETQTESKLLSVAVGEVKLDIELGP